MDTKKKEYLVYEMILFASRGKLDELKEIVEKNELNVNESDYDKRTPLHLASEEDLNCTDRWGATPLRGAILNGHNKVVNLLRDKGAKTKFEQYGSDKGDEVQTEQYRFLFEKILSKGESELSLTNIEKFLKGKGLEQKRNQVLAGEIKELFGESKTVSWDKFLGYLEQKNNILARAFRDQLVIKNWSNFMDEVQEIYDIVKKNTGGEVAQYIPELKIQDPSHFAVSIVTVDGQTLDIGDSTLGFSIQSCVKPLVYSMAIEELGYDWVHQYVGKEPSGVAFNAFTLNSENKPHNSCINAGAIVVSGSYHVELKVADKFKLVLKNLSDYAGGAKIGFDQAVYLSERECAYNNNALAYFISSKNGFPKGATVQDSLDFYFQLCSIEITNQKLATIASTYANNGICPTTGKKVMTSHTVKKALQLLFSCGMYDYSGQWACTVGLPAKSGVAGAVFVVVPSICGICIWSPPLGKEGNSVRGVDFAEKLAEKKMWNIFDVIVNSNIKYKV